MGSKKLTPTNGEKWPQNVCCYCLSRRPVVAMVVITCAIECAYYDRCHCTGHM